MKRVFLAALLLLPPRCAVAAEPADLGGSFRAADELLTNGDYERALAAAREALEAARRAKDAKREAWALDLEGDALYFRGELPAALRSFQAARAAFHALGHRYGEAMALKDVGITQRDLGRFEEALVTLREAREALRAIGDRHAEGSALENMGGVYAALGLPRRALEAYREVLPMAEAEHDPELHAGILIRMGNLAADRDHALGLYRAALVFARESGRPAAEGWALLCLAGTLEGLGRAGEAKEARESARALYRKMGSKGDEAIVLKDVAYAELPADPHLAARTFEAAIGLLSGEEPRVRSALFHGLGIARRRAGDFDGAISALEEALSTIESMRERLERGEHRAAFSSQYQGVTHDLMRALLDRRGEGGDARAFWVVERWRARDMRESLRSRKSPSTRAEDDLPTLRTIQALLGAKGALVSYVLTKEGVLAFLVSGSGFDVVRLSVATDVLDARVTTLVDLLSRGDSGARGVAERVGAEILSPLLSRLPPDVDHLVVIPDGVLDALPFDVLPGRGAGRLLLDEVTVAYAPSATVWADLESEGERKSDGRADLLLFADPSAPDPSSPRASRIRALYEEEGFHLDPLPFARVEASEIARFAGEGSRVLVGDAAARSAFLGADLARYRVLHFATHGVVGRRNPSSSALLLSAAPRDADDGLLHPADIASLSLGCDLVVLSGCRTARGELLAGEGALSLARAFFRAGAPAVVATLWDVNDEGTVRLMKAFYERLARGESAGDALRGAKRKLARSEGPRSWAAFALFGAGDRRIALHGHPFLARLVPIGIGILAIPLALGLWLLLRAPRSALLLPLALVALELRAQPIGAEFQANVTTTFDQWDASVFVLPSGGFVVSWESYLQDGSAFSVWARRFDPTGAPAGGEFRVNSVTTYNQFAPSVAGAGSGFVVVWPSFVGDGSYFGVSGQRYGSSGTPIGGEFVVNATTFGNQSRPAAASDGAGSFVVVWQSDVSDGSGYGIVGQRFDGAGSPLGSEFVIDTSTTGDQFRPIVSAETGGRFAVVWWGNDGDGFGVFARRFDGAGAPLGLDFRVNAFTTGDQGAPCVAAGPGGFLVVWQSLDEDGSGNGVFARHTDWQGLSGPVFRVNTFTTGLQGAPSVSADASGFVVTWQSDGEDGSGLGIYARRYDGAANPLGGEFAVNDFTFDRQAYPWVASGSGGSFVVVWQSYLQDGSSHGVFGRLFSFCTAPDQTAPLVSAPPSVVVAQTVCQ